MADISQTKKPTEAAKWFGFCAEMRDAAAAVNKAIHEGDPKATDKAMKALAESCDNCHNVFNPEQVGKP
jgi:cytochrome c556